MAFLFIASCVTSANTGTTTPGNPPPQPIQQPVGGTGYGGVPYGGRTYGGASYGGVPYGGSTYGTIGMGGGCGGIGCNGRPLHQPTVAIGQPTAQGDLDKSIIRRYIARNISKIKFCYEKQLAANPTLAGTVNASFQITPNGTVGRASATGMDATVATCIADVIRQIEFPKPQGGGSVQVEYPFVFQPSN